MTSPLEQAVALHHQGELEPAVRAYRELLAQNPNYFEALYLLGVALHQIGQLHEAVTCLDRAVALEPNKIMPHYSRGNALRALGAPEQALHSYDRALALKPDFADAHYSRGNALRDLGRDEEALQSYDRALALKSEYPEAWLNRGNALRSLKRGLEALTSIDRALALKPDYLEAWLNQGNVLQDLQRLPESLASIDHALSIKPDYVQALSNRGNVLRAMNQPREALASYRQALALNPGNVGAHWNEALCHLLLGDFQMGWREYEWRWQTEFSKKHRRPFTQPLWLGQASLEGKTILLHAEQGFGDTLQFCRYVTQVAQLGGRILLEVQPELVALLRQLNATQVIARGQTLPAFDYHCPLMSLPLAFQTDLASIPPSKLLPDLERVQTWKKRLGTNPKKHPRIGLSWAGNPVHPNDHNRTMGLEDLLPLTACKAQFFGLQKELRAGDEAVLAAHPQLKPLGHDFADFADTAAAIDLLDLVITVDAAVAHLAGALGKKVWILLPYAPDWRWLQERTDSPWYPSARLFRQSKVGDWAGLIRQVRNELAREVGED